MCVCAVVRECVCVCSGEGVVCAVVRECVCAVVRECVGVCSGEGVWLCGVLAVRLCRPLQNTSCHCWTSLLER